MAESRFERYVREALKEKTQERRDELEKRFNDELASINRRIDTLREIADEAIEALNKRLDAQAAKWGWNVLPDTCRLAELESFNGHAITRYDAARSKYDYGQPGTARLYLYGPVAEAQRALIKFDNAVERAATRLVVCKVDLHMRPEQFDAALDEAVRKLLK